VQSDLLQLLNALSNILVVAKVEVEAALTRCTELTMLCDTMTDCKKVPTKYLLRTYVACHVVRCVRTFMYCTHPAFLLYLM
jgi:hypothetical protein